MRRSESIRELKARLSRGKYAKAKLAVLRDALNGLTDGNYLSVLSLHLSGNLQTRIPGNRRRQVGECVNEAYALCLQEELHSGESTEERDSEEGEKWPQATATLRAECNKQALQNLEFDLRKTLSREHRRNGLGRQHIRDEPTAGPGQRAEP